jgi:hypothetical protein
VVSHAIVDQLTPLLPKDDEEATSKVKQLYALLKVVTLTYLVCAQEAGK